MGSIAGNGHLKNCWCKRVNKAFFFMVSLSLGIVLCMDASHTKLTTGSLIFTEILWFSFGCIFSTIVG